MSQVLHILLGMFVVGMLVVQVYGYREPPTGTPQDKVKTI